MSAWAGEGFSPADFWGTTPREFEAVMQGRAEAHQRATEAAYFQAWATERFAREKKLKPFARYVGDLKPRRAQTADDVLAIFRGFKASGVPMKIRRA